MGVIHDRDVPLLISFTADGGFFPAGILSVGRLMCSTALPIQPVHQHEGVLELLYVQKGSLRITLDGVLHTVSRSSAFVVKPGESHGGANKIIHPGDIYWIMVNLKICRREFGGDFAVVAAALEAISRRSFSVSTSVGESFRELIAECSAPADAFRKSALAAIAKTLLTIVAREYRVFLAVAGECDISNERNISKVIEWMKTRIEKNWTVADAAAVANMKKSKFYELFIARTGYAPIEYRNHARIERAKEMLQQTKRTVTDITFSLGFCSSQYFASVFKKLEGVSPSKFRRDHAR